LPKVIGGLAALIAIAGGIIAHVDPVTSLWRAGLVFLLGWVLTQVWYVFFTVRVQSPAGTATEPQAQSGSRSET
jgi:hypothetical protein